MIRKNELNKVDIVKRMAIFCSVFLLLVFMGCETLDFNDPNAPTTENVGVQNLVTGTEAGMRLEFQGYLRDVALVGREAYFFAAEDPRFSTILSGPLAAGGPFLNRPWNARYRVVGNANFLLDLAAGFPSQVGAGVAGFAKTIMAYQLLLNLNLTYNNGIKIEFSEDRNTPFVSKEEALAEIARLIDDGNSDLAAAGDAFSFILSSGFAGFNSPSGFSQFNRALRARVTAYVASESGSAQDWQTVLDVLEDSFLDPAGDLNRGVYHIYGTGLGDELNPIFESPTAAGIQFRGHPSFETDAEPDDNRFSSKVVVRPDLTEPVFDLVSTLAINVSKSITDPFPIIRNEELILLRAEANIGLGNFAAADDDMNIVRNAAGLVGYGEPGGPPASDASNALDHLLHERRYSLFIEGHRWVDMRRYDRLDQLPLDRAGDVVIESQPRPVNELPD
ncbi:RagB/SusD family nutrient uptake outer membrane protein [candidate division KSB1 bacterium]|nr:RagB/SusD family nutrient uptake outer membrane protein [candidate division KSB1 bacterium]